VPRGNRPLSRLAARLRRGGASAQARQDRRAQTISLTVIISKETCDRLRERAAEAARRRGLNETDITYGGFVADHLGGSLEEAYAANGADFVPRPAEGPATFVAVSLSPAAAQLLRSHVEEDAYRAGVAAGKANDEFVSRRMGQRLEAAYRSHGR
jgi:hypothetical protein